MVNIVYVYGTLINPALPVEHSIQGSIYDLGWFPGLKLGDDPDVVVKAQRHEISDEKLREWDRYEGHNREKPEESFFRRIPYLDGFVYIYNHDVDTDRVILPGDWLDYFQQKERKVVHK